MNFTKALVVILLTSSVASHESTRFRRDFLRNLLQRITDARNRIINDIINMDKGCEAEEESEQEEEMSRDEEVVQGAV